MSKVTVKSLQVPEFEGWMTKQGGSVKTWKRRWFVLKGPTLYYFKAREPETEAQGQIDLSSQTTVRPESKHGKKQAFAISHPAQKRIFFMYADQDSDSVTWIRCINAAIDRMKGIESASGTTSSSGGLTSSVGAVSSSGTGLSGVAPYNASAGANSGAASGGATAANATPNNINANNTSRPGMGVSTGAGAGAGNGNVRAVLTAGRNEVYFLKEEDTKVLEFWQIWFDSIPPREDLTAGSIDYEVATSADMQKLTWRAAGPQTIFIQRMVDFFWNVGAPETEIDRLNDVGGNINPQIIGSWIDMSSKRGMDGGWFFPADIPIRYALDATDRGEPTRKLAQFVERYQIDQCYSVGRDMGAAPPRQTEIRFRVPGETFDAQLNVALSAFAEFGFPPLPEEALDIVRSVPRPGLRMSVVTSSEGFVRLGVMIPDPDRSALDRLCPLSGASSSEPLLRFSESLGLSGPSFVEFQFLMRGFGYGVYKEGFDVMFHYAVGKEEAK